VGGLGALTLSRASGVDGKSTFFASIPGGAMAMAVLADRYGAQIAPVAVAHSLRVSLVVIIVPFALTYGGFPLVAAAYRPNLPLDISILLPWLALGWLAGELTERFRFHNGCLLTPIFIGAALTMCGVQLSAVPHVLTDFAQLMFGLVLGARYERAFFMRYKLFIPFALLNSCCPRLGVRSPGGDHGSRNGSGRLGRNDHYRASPQNQRPASRRFSSLSRRHRQHGNTIYLHFDGSIIGAIRRTDDTHRGSQRVSGKLVAESFRSIVLLAFKFIRIELQ
jgi:hypothetical protein